MLNNRRSNILFTQSEKNYIQHEVEKYRIDIVFKFLYTRLINISLVLFLLLSLDLFSLFYTDEDKIFLYYMLTLIGANFILVFICFCFKFKNIKHKYTLYYIYLTSMLPVLLFLIHLSYNLERYINIFL